MTRLATLAVSVVLVAATTAPASAGMFTKLGGLAVAGFVAKKGADACLGNPTCAARLAGKGQVLVSRGSAACARSAACTSGAEKVASSLSGFMARYGHSPY